MSSPPLPPEPLRPRGARVRAPLALAFALAAFLPPAPARAGAPRVHAIVGARIVVAPGRVIEHGTIVMRDGLVAAVGANVAVPPDARIWPGDSLTVYPGLIDAFVTPSEPAASPAGAGPGRAPAPAASRGAAHELAAVQPETRMVESLPLPREQVETLRAAGFTVAQVAPRRGIVRGQSAVIGLGDGAPNQNVLAADAAQVIALEPVRQGYPGSLMGAIAVIRQAFLDARWYRDVRQAYAKAPQGKPRPETNASWEALQPVVAGSQPALFVADDMLEVLRAARIAREAEVRAQVVGGGDEYKRVREIAAAGVALVEPVNFPDPPDVSDPDDALDVPVEELRHWQAAPGNPGELAKAGVAFALTSNGLKEVKKFRAAVAKSIARGWKGDDALAAVTTVPARLLGLETRLGTLDPGKVANLTVTHGELFSEGGKVREVWVDGNRYEAFERDDHGMKGSWSLGWGHARHPLMVSADKDTSVKLVVGADTLKATGVDLSGDLLRFTVQRGAEKPEVFELAAKGDQCVGTLAVFGAGAHDVSGWRQAEAGGEGKGAKPEAKKEEPVAVPAVMGNTEPWRATPPAAPVAVLVRNATIWTAGPQGTLREADLLVQGGRIAAVGKDLRAPAHAVVIDGTGKHVAPGIIDEHSHSAILGNVNECTNSVTCEVRIQDVINSESVNIYRQLAGGTTIMHLLHGSCNAIGGQCAVIKNKWGEPPDRLLFAAAPPTVKFALGENPKQSNWGTDRTGRYPQSRAGVEETIRDAFTRALDYQAQWAEYHKHQRPFPPRQDLQLEALAEIVEGKRLIHCHSYRQDEVLMLMRLAEQFGVHVNTFTHILEGYKVADEMAAHGASAIGFSDWWAYKYEVIDAIPYSGYLMWDRGVNTGFNSDSDELARRLNTEAAKAVKYGGVPPEEAIKFVTLNPAKSLRIDGRVGSLEPGKDADFAIWSGSPLSPYSRCEQTWIEGRKYFDRAADLAGREALAKERDALVASARLAKKGGAPGGAGRGNWPPRYLEETDMSGNECGTGGYDQPFRSESERRALRGEAR
ncbi:MAG TPA: amidohydrolase family protein [Candidatus Eisenbacteria bacterium]|jgi:imidazolonepropionase-like amidohydrolase